MIKTKFRFGRGLIEMDYPIILLPEFNPNLGMDESSQEAIYLLPMYNAAIIGTDCLSGRVIYDKFLVGMIYEEKIIKESLDDEYGPYDSEDGDAFSFACDLVVEHFFWLEANRRENSPLIIYDWDIHRPD